MRLNDAHETVRDRQLSAALRAALPLYPAPPALRRAVATAIRDAHAPRRQFASGPPAQWSASGATRHLIAASILVATAAASFAGGRAAGRRAVDDRGPADAVMTGYARSLVAATPIDVISSDRHTVKPWFTGKLDYSPPVTDLASRGYPLVGGRLDFVDGRRVAALVYARGQHTIDLYVWPSDAQHRITDRARSGYTIANWSAAGMTFWAISDCEPSDLRTFATLVSASR